MKKTQSGPQSAQRRSKVFEQVVKDLRARDQQGFSQYGKALEDANIDSLAELYEEILDAAVYLRRLMNERERWIIQPWPIARNK